MGNLLARPRAVARVERAAGRVVHETETPSASRAERHLPLRARSSTGWAGGALRYDSGLKAHRSCRAAPRWTALWSCGSKYHSKFYLVPNPVAPAKHTSRQSAKSTRPRCCLFHTWYDGAGNLVAVSDANG